VKTPAATQKFCAVLLMIALLFCHQHKQQQQSGAAKLKI